MPDRLLRAKAGTGLNVLGNDAIVRGAIEAGVEFVSGYPGTPASEIGDTFARIQRQAGICFEWSVNEKVALEAAFGAAIMGVRSLVYMKHLGLAAAGDPLGTIPYVGVLGSMVIVSAGDPGMVVSPNEQDQRHLARMNMIPVLEPATPAEACLMTRFAFDLSEKTGLPVILRTTPAVAHTRGAIELGKPEERTTRPAFRRRPAELNPIPVNARRMRSELDDRLRKAEALLAESPFFQRTGDGRLGVLAVGAPAALVLDQVEELGLAAKLTVQRIGATYPLPRSVLERFLAEVDQVLVVEELTPFVEDQLRALAQEIRPAIEILGKRQGLLPESMAYTAGLVADRLATFAGIKPPQPATLQLPALPALPPRPPVLCPGCPHRGSYLAARTVFGDAGIYFNDIGCYTLGYGRPLECADALLAMGSSIAMAAAASRVLGRKTLAFIGDSTFFHSGMPPLLNAAMAGDDVLVVVLDNRITAMTGHQPSPCTPRQEQARPEPEAVARALTIQQVAVVDPNNLRQTVDAFREAQSRPGPALIVARRDCSILSFRAEGAAPKRRRFAVDTHRCRHCGHQAEGLFCGQGPLREYERAMVLRRILDQDQSAALPAAVGPEPPCSVACPANICVQGYVGRIAGGRFSEALALIRRRNPLPVVSSRVCHRPCEDVCTRRDSDGAIAVNDLKRFLVDSEMAAQPEPAPPATLAPPSGQRIAVVGAGPSGLAAAHELRLRGHEVVIFDEFERPGGLLVQAIPAHRLDRDVLSWEVDWILGHGIKLASGVRLGRDTTVEKLLADFAAVYLGVGAMNGLPLGVPGENLAGNLSALDLLRSHHRGEPIAATGKRFVVVGGGDAAVDAARTLVRLGAAEVTIAYRRSRQEMPAHPEEVVAAEQEGVTLMTARAPLRVLGTKQVSGLEVITTEPGPSDASGRQQPLPVAGSEREIPADHVVSAIGQGPDLGFLDVELGLTSGGQISIDPATGATSLARVFAGGDVTPGPKTVIHAIADGRRAAYGIDLLLADEDKTVVPVEGVSDEGLEFFQPRNLSVEPGHRASLRPAEQRRRDHHDVVVPLTAEQAQQEAVRCLQCGMCHSCSACTDLFGCPAFRESDGKMVIDEQLCSGCGVCVAFCPNGAIFEVQP